jgi:acetyltransferase-like isoleucine patch superfamily enzyme
MSAFSFRNIQGGLRWLGLRVRHPHIKPSLFFIDKRAEFYFGKQASLQVGTGVITLYDLTARIEAPVKIGNDVFFNRGCHIVVKDGLEIGDRSLFGEYVSIHDESHTIKDGRVEGRNIFESKKIIIGSDVWVGAKATILPGVTIGDRCIIGANAVVTKDIPAGSIAVGVPAKVIREI